MSIKQHLDALVAELDTMDLDRQVDALNQIRARIHDHGPFRSEPVDCVQWIKASQITANDYNPNSVAPPEMELLRHSITEDGYTQPQRAA